MMNKASEEHGKWLLWSAMGFAFFMSLWQAILPLFLLMFIISWIRYSYWSPVIDMRQPLFWSALLYVLHLIGMAWSDNWNYGLFDLEIKSSLLLLPLLGMLWPRNSNSLLPPVLLAFILGNCIAVGAGLIHVVQILYTDESLSIGSIFGSRFSFLIHPSYFALHLVFGITAILLGILKLPAKMLLALLFISLIGVMFSGSKMGWISLLLMLPMVALFRWKEKDFRRVILITVGSAIAGVAILIAFSGPVRERVVEMFSATSGPIDPAATTSSQVRRMAWAGAMEVTTDHLPIGAGTGDVKDKLIDTYEKHGFDFLVEHRINAHSQFLQMSAALGIAGILLITLVVLIPLIFGTAGDRLYQIFLLLCLINWSVESMLEVQAGVLFFAFFALLMTTCHHRSSPHDPVQSPAHR